MLGANNCRLTYLNKIETVIQIMDMDRGLHIPNLGSIPYISRSSTALQLYNHYIPQINPSG